MLGHWEIAEEAAEYVYQNLDRRVPVSEIAERCSFSPFHLNRIFRSVIGESLYEFEKRMRLSRAASRLLKEPSTDITVIALDSGYSPSNFSVAFKERYGTSPIDWRSQAASGRVAGIANIADEFSAVLLRIAELRSPAACEKASSLASRVRVARIDPFTAYRSRYRGPFTALVSAWDDFCVQAAAATRKDEERFGPFPGERRVFGVSLEDPFLSRPDRFAYDLCVEVRSGHGRDYIRIPGGTYARYDWAGFSDGIPEAFNEFLGIAMPLRGLRMTDKGPCIELYKPTEDPARFELTILAPLAVDGVKESEKTARNQKR